MVRKLTKDKLQEVAEQRALRPDLWIAGGEHPEHRIIMAEQKRMEQDPRNLLEQKLKHNFFIVAGGAWQHLWEREDTPSIGFTSDESKQLTPTQAELRGSIRPELLKRFRSEISVMQAMSKEDYEQVTLSIYEDLPLKYRDIFFSYAHKRMDAAVEEKIGMRYFEEILSQTLTSPLLAKESKKDKTLTPIEPF